MLKTIALAASLLACAAGCSVEQGQGGTTSASDAPAPFQCPVGQAYHVRVSTAVSADWQGATVAALAEWSRLLGQSFSYDVTVSDDVSWSLNGCEIAVVEGSAGNEFWGEAVTVKGPDGRLAGAVVQLNSSAAHATPEVGYATALHEVGHVLGLAHDSVRTDCSIMYPFITVPGVLGCADAIPACAAWGCQVPAACSSPSVCLP